MTPRPGQHESPGSGGLHTTHADRTLSDHDHEPEDHPDPYEGWGWDPEEET